MKRFTGKETPWEMRKALLDCGEIMTQKLLELTKDPKDIEQILLVRTLQVDILGQMSREEPLSLPVPEGELLS